MTPPHATPVGPDLPMPFTHAGVDQLVSIWLAQLDVIRDLAEELTAEQWAAASPCPGWSAGDVVAHVLALESELHGAPLTDHEPDWAALPHITSDFGRLTERAVDWYRTKGQDVVVAELIEITAWRRDDLAHAWNADSDPNEVVTGPLGLELPRERLIRTRILDTWVHEQDIRTAIGIPGGLRSDAAWVCAGQFAFGLPYVWGKKAAAPIGATLDLTVTGPGVSFERLVQINENGRAEFIERTATPATVSLTLDWPTYAAASAGRLNSDSTGALVANSCRGDDQLAARLMPALAVTP
ncbi:MAG: maleylpyruvate isomerase family mycothiol-dependent enzyme [Actinobacteria bacterium]|nr:maleylpyruvate isomerase family mycothiol-dependent enzyme [Actinomycetota bacterium]